MSEYIVIHGIRIAKDFTPETFGRLTTIGPKFLLPFGNRGRRQAFQVCKCSCGTIIVLQHGLLKRSSTRSCGCLQKELASIRRKTHGLSRSPEYRTWVNINYRCYNSNYTSYKNYGGRGIAVCDRWREPDDKGFLNFLADMGKRPSKQHSIERENNNGNYEPGNCRWATRHEQNRNQRSNVNLTYNGKTQCIADWEKEFSLGRAVLRNRLK